MLEIETKEENEEEVLRRERETERQELVRLLGTAKDAERREIIRNAIAALDAQAAAAVSVGEEEGKSMQVSSSASNLHAVGANGLNPAVASRLLAGGRLPIDSLSGSGRNRPTSAQRRRPSFTPAFEVVPEVSH